MEIRTAHPSEAAAVAELAARLFRWTYADQVPLPDTEAYIRSALTAEALAAEMAESGAAVLVGAEGPDLAAYAQLRTSAPPLARADPESLEIARFYLDPLLQGTGFASTLMAACLGWGRERQRPGVWLQVWELNQRAIAFYLKEGFADVGQTTFQVGNILYRDRVMVRSLSD
jgi:ribosomal protein S18 acetylase RimI-like enzyme